MGENSQLIEIPDTPEVRDSVEKRIIPKKSRAKTRQSKAKNEPKPIASQVCSLCGMNQTIGITVCYLGQRIIEPKPMASL
jgi:hypothetical protein